MTSTYPYLETLRYISERCETLFGTAPAEFCEPLTEAEVAAIVAEQEHPEGVSPQLVAMCRQCDSFSLEWNVTDEQEALGLEGSGGRIWLGSLESMCSSWNDEFGVELFENSQHESHRELARRLRDFRVVDQFADPYIVGIYCDERRDQELYYYADGEGDLPEPLGVDLPGYLELMKLSLGYVYWQLLLVELNTYFAGPRTAPFTVETLDPQGFVDDMTKLNPDFTLEAFVARYDAVRLRR